MTVNACYHAILREQTGKAEEACELPAGADGAALLREVVRRYPRLAGLAPSLKLAVNEEIAPNDTVLKDGDRVDLLPPFGGG